MLIDAYGRKIDYLRISVTDRCNLRCIYCMPAYGILHKDQNQILSFEEIHKIVNVAAGLGIKKVRITGGEPLARKDLPLLVEKLRSIAALEEITLTTNGTFLNEYARSLKMAGLDRINISLDSLNPKKFQRITRGGDLKMVLKGLESALVASLAPVKINTVLINGFNEDEILDFVKLTQNQPLHIRFIEYMSTSLNCSSGKDFFFGGLKAKEICSKLGRLIPVDLELAGTTAQLFKIESFCGTIGFISPISEPFCYSCNKLRLTSDGRLKSCLHSSKTINLKAALDKERQGDSRVMIDLFKEAVEIKPYAHNLMHTSLGGEPCDFSMCQIGG